MEISRGYGLKKISDTVPAEDCHQMAAVLGNVRESVCARRCPEKAGERNDHNMAFFGEGKLLYIHSAELWSYLLETVNTKAK